MLSGNPCVARLAVHLAIWGLLASLASCFGRPAGRVGIAPASGGAQGPLQSGMRCEWLGIVHIFLDVAWKGS